MDWVIHVDLDEFLAAVEVRRRPELRGLPVIVGGSGDPTEPRKVVATASYAARTFGVRSGMPLRMAARRCPDAVFLPSDVPVYEAASAEVMAALRSLAVIVEEIGWDEAFVGPVTRPATKPPATRGSGPVDANDPEGDVEQLAVDLQAVVRDQTRLSCAVGIGDNKLQAKLATGFAKPGRIHRLTSESWMAVMGERPVESLWGIGSRTSARLAVLGITTVQGLAGADHEELAAHFGPRIGPHLRWTALGKGDTRLDPNPHVPRSRSHETTFPRNLTDRAEIDGHLDRFARELAAEAASEGRKVMRVAVKVRFAPFFTQTRVTTLAEPTDDGTAIAAAAQTVLERFGPLRPIRLLGVRIDFVEP